MVFELSCNRREVHTECHPYKGPKRRHGAQRGGEVWHELETSLLRLRRLVTTTTTNTTTARNYDYDHHYDYDHYSPGCSIRLCTNRGHFKFVNDDPQPLLI